MRMRAKDAAAGIMMVLAVVAVRAAGDLSLLPADGFVQGWSKDGAAKVYEGEALYDHIDGGGEAFLEMGFEACTVQRYRRGPETLTVEIYRMADPAAALGIYWANCGRETPDPSFAERHTVGRNQILMDKGADYVVATGPEPAPGLPRVLVAAARAVADKIPAAEPPPCLTLLPKEGLEPRSVRILRGPIGMQAMVSLGEGDVLLLGRTVTAVAGEYKDKDGALRTLIVAEYPTAAAADGALRHLVEHLDSACSILSAGDGHLVFKDYKGQFGLATTAGRTLTIQTGLAKEPAR